MAYSFHNEVKGLLDETGVPYSEDVHIWPKESNAAEELREQICSTLQEALPDLKRAVRQYMTREAVHDKDFKVAAAIWRSLDSIVDATAKLSQSEF